MSGAPVVQADEEMVHSGHVEMVQDGRAIVLARGNRSLVDSVPPLADIVQVVGARDHTCALTTIGVKCWGKRGLMAGDTQHRLTPGV